MLQIQLLTEDDKKRALKRDRQRARRRADPETEREYCRQYYLRHLEDERRKDREYRETHREQQREHARKYRAAHLDQEKERNRLYRAANREKLRMYSREQKRLRAYGLPFGQFDAMLAEQKGLCACCGLPPKNSRRWHIDHCHSTGRVRALLCNNCNVGIGYFGESIERLQAAIAYLQRYATPSLSTPRASSARL